MDRIHDSDDSAEILFRYLRKNRPEINAWFVVQRGTPDWKRLKADGYKRIIGYGTPLWLLLLAHAEHMISSHADKPVVSPPAFLRIFEPKWRFTFLQHGVIKDDLSKWLNPKPIDLFITSTVAEHASIAGDGSPYRFTARETKLTELPRFDRLRKAAKSVSAEHQNLILVTPTWRNWLLPPLKTGSQRREPLRDILNSEYVQQWDALLRSEALRVAAEKHNLTIAFMPHPNLQGLQHIMGLPAYIQPLTYTGANVQRLFARAAVLVTDYSSIAFNAAYMDRPVVYFQFDSERVFRGGHVGSAGYFSYEDDGFGPVTYDLDSAERAIHATLEFGKTPQTQYATRIDNAFVYRDGKACQRVTQQILSLNSPVPVRKTWVRHPSPVAPGSGHPDDEASVGRHVDPHVQRSDSEIERNLFGDR